MLVPLRLLLSRVALGALLLLAPAAVADSPPTPAAPPPTPATAAPAYAPAPAVVRYRAPQAERLRELRSQREFQYVEVRSEQSGWSRLWRRFWQWVGELLQTPVGQAAWQYGFYAFLVLALGYAVLKLLQVDVTRAFGRAPKDGLLPYDITDENLEVLNFEAAISEAEAQENYRVAVRLGYLQALKHLADRGLVRLQPEKTNHDYLYELPDGPLPPAFRQLTRQFEYVWYGEHDDLSATQYAQVRTTRQQFLQLLSATRHAA